MTSHSVAAVALVTGLSIAALGFTASSTSSPDDPTKVFYADEQPLGEGTVRTWVRLNDSGTPEALGVAVSQRAVETLPDAESLPPPFHMYNLVLPLPAEAAATGFDHVLFDWNAVGHDPLALYSAPHFDVHFYMIDADTRMAIDPSDPDFEAKGLKEPSPDHIPADYMSPPGNFTVPQMGTHWLDRHTPELNGQPFSQTMIYGFYDGRMIFIEPMLTIEYLKSKPNLTQAVKQPARFERPGYYPTSYSIRYDETESSYLISIEGLTQHAADAPSSHAH